MFGYAELVPQPDVNYRHEYLSGVVHVPSSSNLPITITAMIVNRGEIGGFARVRFYAPPGGEPFFDSNDQPGVGFVAPGQVFKFGWAGTQGEGAFGQTCWLRISTTSLDLVPSVAFLPRFEPSKFDTKFIPSVQPGDFAIFELPFRVLPKPPIGPIEP